MTTFFISWRVKRIKKLDICWNPSSPIFQYIRSDAAPTIKRSRWRGVASKSRMDNSGKGGASRELQHIDDKIVHRQFLYSDTVEREMATQEKSHSMSHLPTQTRSGSRIGGLVKSIQRSCSSNLEKNSKYWSGIDGSSRENHNPLTSSSVCHAKPSPTSTSQLTSGDHNLAPRRPAIWMESDVSIVKSLAEINKEDF